MANFIGGMGANHLEHDKLVKIVMSMENYKPVPYDNRKCVRVRDLYCDEVNFMYDMIPYVAEPKFDGFSYLSTEGHMMSKGLSQSAGTKGQIIDKSGHIPHITNSMRALYDYCGIDVQGEIYKVGGTSDDVTSILGCTEDEAIFRQERDGYNLRYMIFDLRKFKDIDVTHEPYYVRRALLEWVHMTYAQHLPSLDIPEIITTQPIMAFNHIVSHGGEGLIIKNTDRIFVPGKKPEGSWIKAKKEITLEVIIMHLNGGGSGKNRDLFKSLAIGLCINGSQVLAGAVHSGISDELRAQIWDNPSAYIGKIIEVDAMEYNGKNISLRHARFVRFRPDKPFGECTPDGIRVKVDII